MATDALGDEKPALFLRNATGLVRGWSGAAPGLDLQYLAATSP